VQRTLRAPSQHRGVGQRVAICVFRGLQFWSVKRSSVPLGRWALPALCQCIPGAASAAVHDQMSLFLQLAEVWLERVPARAGQRNYAADGNASVFACVLHDLLSPLTIQSRLLPNLVATPRRES